MRRAALSLFVLGPWLAACGRSLDQTAERTVANGGEAGAAGRGQAGAAGAFIRAGAGGSEQAGGGSSSNGGAAAGPGGGGTAGKSGAGAAGGIGSAGAGGATSAGAAGTGNGGATSGSGGTGGAAGSASEPIPCTEGVPTSGICDGNTLRFCQGEQIVGEMVLAARQISVPCGPAFVCQVSTLGASCQPSSACVPGARACAPDGAGIATCGATGAGYSSEPCPIGSACEAKQAGAPLCVPPATGADTLVGCVTYERRSLITTGMGGVSEPSIVPASWVNVAAYDEADLVLGAGTTDHEGCFTIALSKKPTADTRVFVSAVAFDPGSPVPVFAVAHGQPDTSGGNLLKTFPGYWSWRNQQSCPQGASIQAPVQLDAFGAGRHGLGTVDHDPAAHPGPDLLIPEACGSGALAVFAELRLATARVASDHLLLETLAGETMPSTESLPRSSWVAAWQPGIDVACSACFSQLANGPFRVALPNGEEDLFDAAFYFSGTEQNPTHWARSVLAHEAGHWVLSTYSRTPGEGGVHYVGQASKPGLAYNEGWATAFGQWSVSRPSDGFWDPRFVDRQDGTTYYVDLAQLSYSGGLLQLPEADAKLESFVNENVVASMIFRLAAPATSIAAGQGLGPDALGRALVSARLKDPLLERGYHRVDLVDLFDAGRCTGAFPEGSIAAVAKVCGFPWDANPRCE